MGGTLLRFLIPEIRRSRHELIQGHDTEVLCAAPELREVISASRETLTSLAMPQERTRFYSRLQTRRIANGPADLLRDYLIGGSVNGTASDFMFRWELDEPADAEFAGLSHDARKALAGFMDAVVIVDPAEYRRRPESCSAMTLWYSRT